MFHQQAAFSYQVPHDPRKTLVTTGEQFEQMMRQMMASRWKIFDHETDGLRWFQGDRSCGLALGTYDERGVRSWYVPYRHRTGEQQLDIERIRQPIQRMFNDPYSVYVAHHLKFDDHMNRREGWHLGGKRYCTQVAGRLFDENKPLGLKKRANLILGIDNAALWEENLDNEVKRLAARRKMNLKPYKALMGYSEVSTTLAGYYACFDIDFTGQLCAHYEGWGLSSHYAEIWQTEMELNEALVDMEEFGTPIDVEYLTGLRDRLNQVSWTLLGQIRESLGDSDFEGSDNEVRQLLYHYWQLPQWKFTRGGEPSVDREVMESYEDAHPVMPTLMLFKDCEKIRTTWTDSILDALDDNNVLHGALNQDGTNSGRLSSSGPNLQNFAHDSEDRAEQNDGVDPWSVRRAFAMRYDTPRLYFDYSQIELRVLTWYTRDPIMMDVYLNGGDVHERTRAEVSEMSGRELKRRHAKIINFGLVYGMTAMGFARQAKIPIEEAEHWLGAFFQKYSAIMPYRQRFWHESRQRGNRFMNIFGRTRHIPDLNSYDGKKRRRAERQLFGCLIQGSAGELTKKSIVRVHQWLKSEGLQSRLVSTVHDEISLDVPKHELSRVVPAVKRLMEDFPMLNPVPVIVDAEYSLGHWGDKTTLTEEALCSLTTSSAYKTWNPSTSTALTAVAT